jgi:hypothetical protein
MVYGGSLPVGSVLVTIIDVIRGLLVGVYLAGGPWFVLLGVVECDGCGFEEGAILDVGEVLPVLYFELVGLCVDCLKVGLGMHSILDHGV